jgi:hypothetical protein
MDLFDERIDAEGTYSTNGSTPRFGFVAAGGMDPFNCT